jgi:hypothetical protein
MSSKDIKLQVLYGKLLATSREDACQDYRRRMDSLPSECGPEEKPKEFILADHDETGDVITGSWPLNTEKRRENLRCLLYGARETGQLPSDTEKVLLPDGQEFVIEE